MGILFTLLSAYVLGTVVAWPIGLGHLGTKWHVGLGLAGIAVSWAFMMFLPLPSIMRITVNGWAIYPVWGAVGTLMVGVVGALAQPEPQEAE